MKPIPKYYTKTFLFYLVIFSFVFTIVDYLFDSGFHPLKNLVRIFGFSFLTTIITVLEKLKKIRKLGFTEITDELLSNHQIREFETQLSIDEIKRIIENDTKSKKLKIFFDDNSLILSSKVTLTTWGEYIKIQLISLSDSINKIKIICKPKFFMNNMDYGKNLENVIYYRNLWQN